MRLLLLRTLSIGALCAVAAAAPGCDRHSSAPGELPGATTPELVSEADLRALVATARRTAFTLEWELQGKGKAAVAANGDRFVLLPDGSGFVNRGLRSWEVTAQPDGSLTWTGPYAGWIPQKPFLHHYQRMSPVRLGIVETLEQLGPKLQRQVLSEAEERWLGPLPGSPDPGITVQGEPRRISRLEVRVRRVNGVPLPIRFLLHWTHEGESVRFTGTYRWREAVIPEVPHDRDQPQLGLAGMWLGEARDAYEPFWFAPTERQQEPDGSETAARPEDGLFVRYDPDGRIAAIRLEKGQLPNGLTIGDDRATVVRRLGPPDVLDDRVMVYGFPGNGRLEIHLKNGRVAAFRAVRGLKGQAHP